MLTELSIRNFAIIDDISITFDEGLTVLTGETGAGKSIIIDAVQLLTGARASVEFVRHGEKKAEITGLFSINEEIQLISTKSEEYGIDLTDEMIVLERVITSQGKSICRINNKIVTLTVLREFGQVLLSVHSQHDNLQIMDTSTHITLLDSYNNKKIEPIKLKYNQVYDKLNELQQKYNVLNENEQQLAQRLDLLKFQQTEISQANLKENEDEELTKEREHLQNFENLFHATQTTYDALYGDQKALEWIDIARKALQDSKINDHLLIKKAEELNDVYFTLEEISFDISHYKDQLFYDENRLNEIESRLNEINLLKRKYGQSVNEIIKYKQKIDQEINEIKHKDSHNEKLMEEITKTKNEALKIANKLSQIRKQTAANLMKQIKIELKELYLDKTTFDVQFSENKDLNTNGIDQVTFMLSTNIGEPLKELNKVASGGEISRIMLALKKIFAKHDQTPTVIFDEIDTGVSGRVAQAIAEKMYQISVSTQVLCITHLPQVAAMSDQHLLITKKEKNERTITYIQELTEKEKIKELGKMITGTKLTQSAIEHSEQLLQLTEHFKEKMTSA